MSSDLLSDLRAEFGRQPDERPTRASDASLQKAIVAVQRGSLEGDEAASIRRLVTDEWSYTAPLSEELLAWVDRTAGDR